MNAIFLYLKREAFRVGVVLRDGERSAAKMRTEGAPLQRQRSQTETRSRVRRRTPAKIPASIIHSKSAWVIFPKILIYISGNGSSGTPFLISIFS